MKPRKPVFLKPQLAILWPPIGSMVLSAIILVSAAVGFVTNVLRYQQF